MNHFNSDYSRINMAQDPRKSKVNDPTSIYYQHQPLMRDGTTQTPPGYKARGTISEYHSTSNRQGVNMDSTMAKSIYYHFTSLKKLLSSDEIQQMKPLEDALKSQGKLNPPFGQCYYCKENTHWASDCLKLKTAREQSKTTDKPDYGHCFKCGKPDHWARDCPEISIDKQLDIPPTPRCLETQEATTSVTKTTTKRKFPFEEVSEATPSKQRKVENTTEPQKTRKRIAKKKYCFICKSEDHGAKDCKENDSDDDLKGWLSK